ncbi:MAG TPA: tetratricopeptide repeat protein [Thiotrichaceae bacterium]|nr:tetratricopeptide repeat protein [Thiotrichaceae bacterium]
MSLLMDALKKAEAEKKQAAKRLQDVDIGDREITGENIISDDARSNEDNDSVPELFTETAQLALEPIVDQRFVETEDPVFVDHDDSNDEVEIVLDTLSEDLTLENTIAEGIESDNESFEESINISDLNDTTIIEGLSTENASAPFDDTFNGVLVDEEDPDTDVYEETLPGVAAEQLVKDLGGGQFQPTPVAAKTMFSAGRTNNNQSPFKWGAFIVLSLLASGSFAIFYYFTITPVSRSLPSPLITRGIESSDVEVVTLTPQAVETEVVSGAIISIAVEESPIESVGETNAVQPVLEDTQTKRIVADLDVAEKIDIKQLIADEIKAYENRTKENALIDAKQTDIKTQEEIEKVNETIVDKPVVENKKAIAKKMPEQIAEQAPESIQFNASLISISKSKKLEQVNTVVKQAFKAYQDGRYDAAKSIYESVLISDPDNRDVHLGLAAIAISNQDRKNAYTHYVHLLELNPADSLAMNGLISLSNSADPVKDESAIKLLIQREGDVPYLYFSLGNIYAKQQRWPNAQQAFFDAYRLDNTNSDYVLNLAISLDQIGQYDSALGFYETAINLSQNSSTTFDPNPINNRILALSKLIESKL